ncbi:MAG: FAD-binding oxidoreductase [Chloroflexi bacterium]|nr:FAD-binding oxidoreductase [Chloroflexota bacterium]
MPRTYDAIVIGGGVIGTSIAFHLARAGAGRVVLVERGELCSGNSRKSGAIVRMHYSNDPEAKLALASLPYFQQWSEMVGGSCGFRATGFAILVGEENRERMHRNVARLQALGVETSVLDGRQLREVMPILQTEGVAAAAYEPTSGHADAVATTLSFAEAARRHGAEILQGVSVTGIGVAGGRVTGVDTDDGHLDAPLVICAANTWSPKLLKTAGVDLAVTPRRAQVAYFERPTGHTGRHLVVLDTTTGLYTRAQGDDRLLGGASNETGASPADPDLLDETPSPGFVEAVAERMGDRMPTLGPLTVARVDVGMYDMSPDTRAILDRAPGVDGLYVAAGFSGTGFKKAPAVGLGMAELALTGAATSVDFSPFRSSRFAEEQPIHGADEYVLPLDWGHAF